MELTNLVTLNEHGYVFELLLKILFWSRKIHFLGLENRSYTIILLPFYGRDFTAVNGKKIEVGKFCRKFTVESIGIIL